MKTPEESKRRLECCLRIFRDDQAAQEHNTRILDAVAYIQQLEQCVPRWISVAERLPDESEGLVLIVASGRHKNIVFDKALLLGMYYDGSGWIVEGHTEWEDAHVTHWMPLPAMPEEDEHATD